MPTEDRTLAKLQDQLNRALEENRRYRERAREFSQAEAMIAQEREGQAYLQKELERVSGLLNAANAARDEAQKISRQLREDAVKRNETITVQSQELARLRKVHLEQDGKIRTLERRILAAEESI